MDVLAELLHATLSEFHDTFGGAITGTIAFVAAVFASPVIGREVANLCVSLIKTFSTRIGLRKWLIAHPNVAIVSNAAAGELLTPTETDDRGQA